MSVVPLETPRQSTTEAAAAYLARGWRPIVVNALKKNPKSSAWQNSEPRPENFGAADNIGLDMGRCPALVDVDLDIPQARELAQHRLLFGDLPAFGRQGQTPGHRFVLCTDKPIKVEQFQFSTAKEKDCLAFLASNKMMVLELRAGKGQTVVPPSRYQADNGQIVEIVWAAGAAPADIPEMPWAEVKRRAGTLAFLSVVAAVWPATGSRDAICLPLAGALLRAGWSVEETDALIVATATVAGDDEADRRGGKAESTQKRLEAGEPVAALPALLEGLGLEPLKKRLSGWLNIRDDGNSSALPEVAILVDRADLHNELMEFAALLANKSGQIYRRQMDLVRVCALDADDPGDGLNRRAGLVELRLATPGWLRCEASRVGEFVKRNAEGKFVRVSPPERLALLLRETADTSPFPVVRGLSLTPSLSRDEPGYDPATKLLLAFSEGVFPDPPPPTRIEAEHALARLLHPLRGFPFVDDAARAVALSAMLCAVIRGEMRTCPMHVFDAPAAGSGKSKLADIVGILATGVAPSAVTYAAEQDENEKRLATILRCGDPVILIDNVSADLEGDFLCAMLTQEDVQARILGMSERVRLDTRALVLATDNNMRFRGDISRRVMVCRIDAKMSNPEDRQFDFDCVADVRRDRASLVVDALTILRAYRDAGQPERPKLAAFGSFEDWDLVRGALVWLGLPDPATSRLRAKAENPEIEELAELVRAWLKGVGLNHRTTLADLDRAGDIDAAAGGAGYGKDRLRRDLGGLTNKGVWNKHSVGKLLGKHRDIPFLGVTLRSKPNSAEVQVWWLEGEPDEALQESQGESQGYGPERVDYGRGEPGGEPGESQGEQAECPF
jgi:hypothetical protein